MCIDYIEVCRVLNTSVVLGTTRNIVFPQLRRDALRCIVVCQLVMIENLVAVLIGIRGAHEMTTQVLLGILSVVLMVLI